MGMRGQGAGLRNQAQAELDERPARAFPWLRKNLNRTERVIAFLEFLPITKGPLAGKRMKLLPGQLNFVRAIYATDRKGVRKVRIGVKSEPKGNGKTGLVAGLCLCHLLGPEAEPRGEVYSAAIDRQQAGLIFAEMEAILHQVPEFMVRMNISRFMKRMEVLGGVGEGSTYEALSSDARRAHGLSPTLFAYDELAQAKDRVLLDNLINGLGKRKDALGIVISTQAPDDSHPLSQLIDDGLSGADPSIYVQLTSAPEDADPFSEVTWLACNPALGKFLSLQEMREASERARRIPAFEPSFRNLRLNQRIDAREDERLVTRKVWEECSAPLRDDLAGRVCYAGLDLSGKHDLTSLTLVFPDDGAETSYDILPLFWTPEGAMPERRLREQEMFSLWIRARHLETVPGPVIRYRYMAAKIAELRQRYDIRAIAYDRWRIDDFKIDMADEGVEELPLEPFGQGFKEMAPAIEYFAELALSGRLRHGGHPVMRACVTNAIMVSDPSGNLKIDKDTSSNSAPIRIDGAVTLVMALGIAKRLEAGPVCDVTTMVA
jgi:phage terminase large subunit-like protein